MIGIRRGLRTGEWWSSKIPPLLAVAYASILLGELDGRVALPAVARLLLAVLGVAAYGYVLNDVFDIEEDRRRGKANSMAGLARWQHAAVLLLLAALSFAPLVGSPFGTVSLLLLAVNMALPTLYSVPPIRLKERGALGVLADAMGAHFVPTLFFAVSMTELAGPSAGWRMMGLTLTAAFWALAAGTRGILVHQVRDRQSDLDAGVKTFAGSMDPGSARTFVFRRLFPLELLALLGLLGLVVPVAPILIGVLPVYLLFELAKVLDDWKLPLLDPDVPGAEPYIPLANNELYEIWLPLALAAQVAVTAPVYGILLVLHLAAFLPSLHAAVRDLAPLASVLRWVATGSGRRPVGVQPYSEAQAVERGFTSRKTSPEVRAFVGVPRWGGNGASAFASDLVRGLRASGLEAAVLLTGNPSGRPGEPDRPADFPFVELGRPVDGRAAQDRFALVRFLEHQAPCIYVPHSDLRQSSMLPLLSERVGVARVRHYDADHLDEQVETVVAVKKQMRHGGFGRSGGTLERMAALVRLFTVARRDPSPMPRRGIEH